MLALILAPVPGSANPIVSPAEPPAGIVGAEKEPGQGELVIPTGEHAGRSFPLKHTEVDARIDGIVSRVSVTQIFLNPYDDKIEAIYVFPLPDRAAVDEMLMKVGERTIRGLIKRREEAREIYEQAKLNGHVASLLDQERPNIFTQSVANILPGNQVEVTIRYVEVLVPDEGTYSFVFPMVVGPRYIPGQPVGPPIADLEPQISAINPRSGHGWSPDTDLVPDASRITPPVLKPGERSGHDIAVTLTVDAGVPIRTIESRSHALDIHRPSASQAAVRLKPFDTIPNRDLVVRFRLGSQEPELALLTHRGSDEKGYFVALIAPPDQPPSSMITPKEMVFVVDCSGSMSGEPIAKVKQAMRHALKNLDPRDSFQVIRFSESASGLGPRPLPATSANIKEGLRFIEQLRGSGGTRMIEGIKAALDFPPDPERLRIVCFMTDGYIGNETQILAAIEERLEAGARLFSFGIGSSVNRYLLDRMAEVGRGVVDYVALNEDTDAAVTRFYDRIRSPVLTHIQVDFEGKLEVGDVYPERIPDLFAGHPLLLCGRYTHPGQATVTLSGKLGGEAYTRRYTAELPAETTEERAALASVWARTRIEDLMSRQHRGEKPEVVAEITELGLAHHLMTAYTSFVAVEERIEVAGGVPRTVVVPVEMPQGVSYEGVFGEGDEAVHTMGGQAADLSFGPHMKMSGLRAPLPPSAPPPIAAPKPEPPARERAPGVLDAHVEGRPVQCVLSAPAHRLRVGEQLALEVTVTNTSKGAIELPEPLTLGAGGLELRIIDGSWNVVAVTGSGQALTITQRPREPSPGNSGSTQPARMSLAPGQSLKLTILIGDPTGIRLPGPGLYHFAVATVNGQRVTSNLLSLRIEA